MNGVLCALCFLIPYGFLFVWPPVASVYSATMRVLLPVGAACAFLLIVKGAKWGAAPVWGAAYLLGGVAVSAFMLRIVGITEIYRMAVIIPIMAYVGQSRIQLKAVARVFALSAIAEMLFVVFEPVWANGPDGWKGSFGSSNMIGAFGILIIPFALHMWFTEKSKTWVWVGMAAFVFGTAYIFFGHCRAGMALWLLMGAAMVWKYGRKSQKWRVVGEAIAFLVLAFILVPLTWNDHVSKVSDFGGASVWGRAGSEGATGEWCSKAMFNSHPIAGVGLGNWKAAALKIGLQDKATGHSYNELATLAGEGGTIGLVLFGGMVLTILWASRKRPVLMVALLAMLADSYVFGLRTAAQSFYFAMISGLAIQKREKE